MRSPKVLLLGVAVLLLVLLFPTVSRTLKWSANARTLITIATLDEDQHTYNPWSKHGLFVSPDTAMWLLENMDYPYRGCPPKKECGVPLIAWAGRGFGIASTEAERRSTEVIRILVRKGYSPNSIYEGISALHESVLGNSPDLLLLLLQNGGDVNVTINRPDKDYQGLNVIQFYEYLREKKPDVMDARFRAILYPISQ